MLRPQAVTAQSHTARAQQLAAAEQHLVAEEASLADEERRLHEVVAELAARLQQLRAATAHAQLRAGREAGLAELHQRVHQAHIQQVDVSAHREGALAARAQAVEARQAAAEATRAALKGWAKELSRLAAGLGADEASLGELQHRAREREEALARQAQPPPLPAAAQAQDQAASARRGQPRVRMQAAVDLHSESNFFSGFSTNLSEGGLFVATVHAPPLGTEVDLSFTLPGGRRLSVHGVVRWAREVNDRTPDIFPGVGIQFVDLAPQAAEEIHRFVETREPLFFPE